MKGSNIVLEHLQTALSMELTAVNQYFLHAHTLDDWGLPRLADIMRDEMKEEQGHAGRLMERILFLEGQPDVQTINQISYAQTVRDMFKDNLNDELEARTYYNKAASDCREAGDHVSQELFISLTKDEEEHVDYLETQLRLMDKLSEQIYLQVHVTGEQAERAET